jgi:hypothetical protein
MLYDNIVKAQCIEERKVTISLIITKNFFVRFDLASLRWKGRLRRHWKVSQRFYFAYIYIPLTLYPRRGSRDFSDIFPRILQT